MGSGVGTEVGSDSYGSSGNQSGSYGAGATDDSYGNTSSNTSRGGDSKIGKFIEKAGDMLNNEKLEHKGREKREAAGAGLGGSNEY